eukprot:jgi/Ulvmu1/946/UM102_0029.1
MCDDPSRCFAPAAVRADAPAAAMVRGSTYQEIATPCNLAATGNAQLYCDASNVLCTGVDVATGLRTAAPLPLSDAPPPVTELGATGFISAADPWFMSLTQRHYGPSYAPALIAPPVSKAGLSAVITAVIAVVCVGALLAAAAVLWCRCSRHGSSGGGSTAKGRTISGSGSHGSGRGSVSGSVGGSVGGSRRSAAAAAAAAAAVAAEAAVKSPEEEATAGMSPEAQVVAAASAQLTSDGHASADARSGAMDIAIDSICEPQLSNRSSGAQEVATEPMSTGGYTSMPGPPSVDSCADGITTDTLATDASTTSHRPPGAAAARARALFRGGPIPQPPLISASAGPPSSVASAAASLGGGSLFLDHDASPSTSAFSVSTPAMHAYGEASLPFAQSASVISVQQPGNTHGLATPATTSGNATSSSTFSGAGGTPSHLLGMTSGITSLSGAVGASASVTDSSQSFRFATMASTGSTPAFGGRAYQPTQSDLAMRGLAPPTDGFRYFQPFLEESEEDDLLHASMHSSIHSSLPRGYR